MKPATPLPYKEKDISGSGICEIKSGHNTVAEYVMFGDAAYIVHAANAYPKLVEVLNDLLKTKDEYGDLNKTAINKVWWSAFRTIQELGEAA